LKFLKKILKNFKNQNEKNIIKLFIMPKPFVCDHCKKKEKIHSLRPSRQSNLKFKWMEMEVHKSVHCSRVTNWSYPWNVFLSPFYLGYVCFLESGFWETTFQTFLCLFIIKKVDQRKTLSSQRKIWLGFQESVFLKNLDGKHFPEVVKNLEMSLFADYIKFEPQNFDCYI